MAHVRVYELAKELNLSNHDMIAKLAEMGIEVKSHASGLEDDIVAKVKGYVASPKAASAPAKAKAKVKPSVTLTAEVTVRELAELLEVAPADVQKVLIAGGALVRINQAIGADLAAKVAESLGFSVISPAPVKEPVKEPVKPPVKEEPKAAPVVEAPKPTQKIEAPKPTAKAETPIPVQKKVEAPKPAPKVEAPKVEKPAAAPVPAPPPAPEAPTANVDLKPKAEGKPAPKKKTRLTKPEDLVPRPPIVTILGHVDHGKTTLLDAIRQTNVVDQEFGGITQHIGAYQVDVKGRKITFLDTPGHEAFTAMRMRGAQVTDIAILIVAADDGVMPQTIEAINHAKAAEVQVIVAINKIDKPDANLDRTKQQLAEHGLVIEDWGGDIVAVALSAKSRDNLDELLEMIQLSADMMELKADPHAPVEATVIEAQLDKGKGPIATVLVSEGTLKQGDSVVVGESYGRIKAMLDDRGKRVQKAGPAMPVEIVGLSLVPMAGDKLEVAASEKEARQIAEVRVQEGRDNKLAASGQRITLTDLYKQLQDGVVKDLNVILKCDVQGSVEAVGQSLERLSTEEVRVNMIHTGVGNVGESDILLASASNAVIIGFNIRVDNPAKAAAEVEHIDVRTYNIIYELIDEVRAAMEGLLEPDIKETVIGHAEVRQLFRLPRGGSIAGSYITDGQLRRNAEARVLRDGEVIHTGKVSSLKHVKEDVREINTGFECGIMVDGFSSFQVGDIVEGYIIELIARRIG